LSQQLRQNTTKYLVVSEKSYTFASQNHIIVEHLNYKTMDELQNIQNLIYIIRGHRVMLDFDLAMLYEVETRSLNQTVKRNIRRFPRDFMFQLTEEEWGLISSQFVMTSRMKRPKKSLPYAFTELGALMLSSVLRSSVADETSIKITRAFVAMRQMLSFSTLPEKVVTLAQELYKLKEEVNDILADQNDINESTRAQLDAISTALAELQAKPSETKPRKPIGFIQPEGNDNKK
jgi:hypothetical protein